MYPDIERMCDELNSLSSIPEVDYKKKGLTNVHRTAAQLCRKVYDVYLTSCEAYVDHPGTDFQCCMTKEGDRLFVSVRGSDAKQDWKNNFQCSLTEYPIGSGRMLHSGFLLQWFSVRHEAMSKLDSMLSKHKHNVGSVTFCGHSAGVLSLLFSLEFVSIKGSGEHSAIKVDAVTFGAPRIGNSLFKEHLEASVPVTRIVLDRDIVTKAPFWGGYTHVGTPVQMRNREIIHRDLSCWEGVLCFVRGVLWDQELGIKDHDIGRYCAQIDNHLLTE